MPKDERAGARAPAGLKPNVRLFGDIDDAMLASFLDDYDAALEGDGPIVLELFTLGGDADVARRIALEIRLCRERLGRETVFLGKTNVFSAGITIMTAFPLSHRWLSEDCMLLVHERHVNRQVDFSGPLRANIQIAREILSELETSVDVERRAFAALAEGSRLTADEIMERARGNWYVTAPEAVELGLAAGLI